MKDYARDKNKADFYNLSLCNEIPSFVKEAHLMEEPSLYKLKGAQFADSGNRMFPINSRAETWLSAAYIQKQAHEGSTIDSSTMFRIKEACELWDIDFESIQGDTVVHEKTASRSISISYKDDNAVHAVTSANCGDHLDKIASDILAGNHTHVIRRNVARQLLGAKDALGHSFDRGTQISIEKVAGYGVGHISAVTQAIAQRRCAIDKSCPHHVESLRLVEKVAAESADKDGIIQGDWLDKVASLLDAVDRQEGLNIKYNDTFTSPERQLYSVCLSEVDSFRDSMVKLANGRFFMRDKFNHKKVSEFLSDVFNKEAKDILKTMEDLDARQSDTLCNYIDKFASDVEDEEFVADIEGKAADELSDDPAAPVQEDTIGDVEKSAPVDGQEVLEDASCPKEGVNEDSTARTV
jgi:hypothetical protein